MYCSQCGSPIEEGARFCGACGARILAEPNRSARTAAPEPETENTDVVQAEPVVEDWRDSAAARGYTTGSGYAEDGFQPPMVGTRSKLAAGLLGIFLGSLGIHNFYLGYKQRAIIQLVLGICGIATCGITALIAEIWGLVEGIQILTGTINTDGDGYLLKD